MAETAEARHAGGPAIRRRSPATGWAAWTTRTALVRSAIYAIGLAPAVIVFALALTDRLGPDPIKTLEHDLGTMALRLLLLGLVITPLRTHGGPNLVRYRRAIGLLVFTYALLHVLVWLVLDRGLVGAEILKDLTKRPYIMVGMVAFTVLLPLALTSTDGMIRRLGGPLWRRLHAWVYLAAAAGCVHLLMAVKSWTSEPVAYAAATTALLLWRVWDARRRARPVT